jgi:hypothetical protein
MPFLVPAAHTRVGEVAADVILRQRALDIQAAQQAQQAEEVSQRMAIESMRIDQARREGALQRQFELDKAKADWAARGAEAKADWAARGAEAEAQRQFTSGLEGTRGKREDERTERQNVIAQKQFDANWKIHKQQLDETIKHNELTRQQQNQDKEDRKRNEIYSAAMVEAENVSPDSLPLNILQARWLDRGLSEQQLSSLSAVNNQKRALESKRLSNELLAAAQSGTLGEAGLKRLRQLGLAPELIASAEAQDTLIANKRKTEQALLEQGQYFKQLKATKGNPAGRAELAKEFPVMTEQANRNMARMRLDLLNKAGRQSDTVEGKALALQSALDSLNNEKSQEAIENQFIVFDELKDLITTDINNLTALGEEQKPFATIPKGQPGAGELINPVTPPFAVREGRLNRGLFLNPKGEEFFRRRNMPIPIGGFLPRRGGVPAGLIDIRYGVNPQAFTPQAEAARQQRSNVLAAQMSENIRNSGASPQGKIKAADNLGLKMEDVLSPDEMNQYTQEYWRTARP